MTGFKRGISKVLSPVAIVVLKIHTRLTGTERARVIVQNERGEILLVRGFIGENWTFPGGGLHRKESPESGARRELYEETGLRVDEVRHVVTFQRPESMVGYTAHIFVATISSDMLPTTLFNPLEIIEIKWAPVDHLPHDISALVRPSLKLLSNKQDI